jgi:hypothetical protein
MLHRVTIVEQNHTLTDEEFHRHWTTGHADILIRMPGLVGYAQHHGVERVSGEPSSFPISGFAETWWESAERSNLADSAPAIFDTLLEDERFMLSGATAFAISNPREPEAVPRWRIWIFDPTATSPRLEELCNILKEDGKLATGKILLREPSLPILNRPQLRSLDVEPVGMVVLSYADEESARKAFTSMFARTGEMGCAPTRQIILTYEHRVFPVVSDGAKLSR